MDDSPDFRWQQDEQLHLTLRFIGEVERPLAEDFAAALATIRASPSKLRLTGVGSFEQRKTAAPYGPGVEPKSPLAALAAKVERACLVGGPAARAPRLSPAHHPRPLEGPARPRGRSAFLERHIGFASDPFTVDRLQPVRKPFVAPRRPL